MGPKADPMWEWAAPEKVHGPFLMSAFKEVDDAVEANSFFGQVLLTCMEACEQSMEEQGFKDQVAQTALNLPQVVENVLHGTNSLCQMHACRSVRWRQSFCLGECACASHLERILAAWGAALCKCSDVGQGRLES